MAVFFEEDDAGYKNWLSEHPEGYVLNVHKKPLADKLFLHRASCKSINNDMHQSGAFTERGYRKVCSESIGGIQAWANEKFSSSSTLRIHHCNGRS